MKTELQRNVGISLPHLEGRNRLFFIGFSRYAVSHKKWKLWSCPFRFFPPIPSPAEWDGDGWIGSDIQPHVIRAARDRKIPLVSVGWEKTGGYGTVVMVDENQIGRQAAEHFLERGYTQFAYYGRKGKHFLKRRFQGFDERLREEGFRCERYLESRDVRRSNNWQDNQKTLIAWLHELEKPLGIFCSLDDEAVRVLAACEAGGYVVPQNVAVLGVGNFDGLCENTMPPLSSVVISHEKVGYYGARMLDELMQGRTPPARPRLVDPESRIVLRDSTDLMAVNDSLVSQSLLFIRKRASNGLDVEDILDEVQVSRRTLERRFRRRVHHTPAEAICRYRIQHIQNLLSTTDLSITQISYQCNFDSPQALAKFFKRNTGLTPQEFRNQTRSLPS